jgi:NADPH:quinone reductase-like Zn-dependent oxidoreductase
MKAVVVESGRIAKLVDNHPRPIITADEVLVRVRAAGQNPTDWKHVKFIAAPGTVVGCDFAGEVVEVGANVESIKVGDRLAGCVHGSDGAGYGSFAEFTPVDPNVAFHVPARMSDEEAGVFGVSAGTAAIALFQHLGLRTPDAPYAASEAPKLLVWGASSAAGIFAIQLAKLAGIRTVATASPESHAMLTSLGAEAVFDYRDPGAGAKILAWAGGELVHGLDCISEDSTVPLASNAMSGGTLVLLLSMSAQHKDNNPKVTMKPMLLYTSMGKAFTKFGQTFPRSQVDYEWGCRWNELCSRLVAEDKLHAPKRNNTGGLESFQVGFDLLEQRKVRAEKVVMTW